MSRFVLIGCAAVLLAAAPSSAFAKAEIGLMGIGAYLGFVDAEELDATIGFGGMVDLGTIAPKVRLQGNLDYWSKSEDIETGFGLSDEWTFRDIAIGGTVTYDLVIPDAAVMPYVGGGLALHFAKAEYAGFDESDTKIGFDLVGGARYGATESVDLLGEFRYRIVSDWNQMNLRAGFIYSFAK